jgi:N utilization substance protein B
MTQRRHARECAMEVFYRFDIGNEDVVKTSKEILSNRKFSEAGAEFFQRLVDTTYTNLNNIDAVIESTLQHWTLARLAGIDRAIIRIAACELLFLTDIPPKVVINEAVEIAKKFGTEESPRFINGVLDAIYKQKDNKTTNEHE